jgi:Kelch motif
MPSGSGRVVVAGGLGPGDSSTSATYTLDLRSGQATRGRPLATAVHDTAGAVLPGERMVIGGGGTTEQSAVQVATPDRWRVHGHLPTTRSDLAAVATGGKVYVVGGYDGRTPALAEVLVSADGRRWRRFARLPEPVRYPGVVVARGAIWVFGGERGGAMLDAVQRVDLDNGTARVVARLPRPVGHEAVAALRGRILVAGGRTEQHVLTRRMWWFDPGTRAFTRAGRLPTPCADAGLVVSGDDAYLLGGEAPDFSDRVVLLRRR